MKSLFRAAYIAMSIHFLRKIAEKLIPGNPVLYFIALRPHVPAHPIGGYLLVVNASWHNVPPPGGDTIQDSRHWELVVLPKELLLEYADTWHIREAIPLHQAKGLASDTSPEFRASFDHLCRHMQPRDVHVAVTELRKELRRRRR